MEFLVEFNLTVPEGTPESEVNYRTRAEALAAARLVDAGHLVRLWKLAGAPAESRAIGLYRAGGETELAALLGALPLSGWMDTVTTPLEPHPNDPVALRTPGSVPTASER